MIAPQFITYLMAAALPIGFILSLFVHRRLKATPNKPHVNGFLIVSAGTILTVMTTGLIALTVTQVFGAIAYPKYDATVIHVDAQSVEVEDEDGNEEWKTYYRATYQFTGPNDEVITKRSDHSGTSSVNEGEVIRIAYQDGKIIELNVWGYVFLAVFVLVSIISFWLWHMLMSVLWTQKKAPAQ